VIRCSIASMFPSHSGAVTSIRSRPPSPIEVIAE
jgi:hypothetical protein